MKGEFMSILVCACWYGRNVWVVYWGLLSDSSSKGEAHVFLLPLDENEKDSQAWLILFVCVCVCGWGKLCVHVCVLLSTDTCVWVCVCVCVCVRWMSLDLSSLCNSLGEEADNRHRVALTWYKQMSWRNIQWWDTIFNPRSDDQRKCLCLRRIIYYVKGLSRD